jgi:hypothetical protein
MRRDHCIVILQNHSLQLQGPFPLLFQVACLEMKRRNFNDKLLEQNVSTIRNPLTLNFLIRWVYQLANACPIPQGWLNVSRRQSHDPQFLTVVHHQVLPTSTSNQKRDLHCKFLEYCIMDKVQNLGNPKCNMPHQKTPHNWLWDYVHVQTHNYLTTPAKLVTFNLVPLWALNSVIKLSQWENKSLLSSFWNVQQAIRVIKMKWIRKVI